MTKEILVAKKKLKHDFKDPDEVTGPLFSVRFLLALVLIVAGIAWVVIWTLYVRDLRTFETTFPQPEGGAPDTLIPGIEKLKSWNWLVGFGLLFVGLMVAAHPDTPLGRGRGVVAGMLACFLIGLIWIVLFYVFANKPEGEIWLLGDLGQVNLMVGIGFMAVGFTYATRWE
ncbi:cell division protein CrgA [Nocardioides sp. AE5]|uniref:cell division protein CrgA n=1 Tax=Nocardioides sp. AE5 TaxID=2962573 RepID=UPI002880C669|nr:cell division protein CrgA [Nocardioides sp. AE5]MDT0202389.1 cell division protein CrgA [Nocardioides sp. AE5]